MRVLFVISDLAFHGAQKQVVELARELDRAGHGVAICTLNADVGRARELVGTGVEVIAGDGSVDVLMGPAAARMSAFQRLDVARVP